MGFLHAETCDGCHNLPPSLGSHRRPAEGVERLNLRRLVAASAQLGCQALVTWITGGAACRKAYRSESNCTACRRARTSQSRADCLHPGSAARTTACHWSRSTRSSPAPSDLGSLFHQCGSEVLQRPAPHPGQRTGQPDAHRRRGRGAVPAQRRPRPAAGARRRPPGAGLRLLRARRRHQRPRPGAHRPGADAGPRRSALFAEPVHVHVRGRAGARPRDGPARRLRQPDHVVAVVERSAAGAGPIGGEHHRGADAGPVQRQAPPARRRAVRCSASRCPALEPGSGTLHALSDAWNSAVGRAERAMADGQDRRRGRRAGRRDGRRLLAQAARHTYPRDRILSATRARPDGRPDLAATVDARAGQGAHRGDRARRRPAAGVGGRATPGSGRAQRRTCGGAVRRHRRALRRDPACVGRPGRHRRDDPAAAGPAR